MSAGLSEERLAEIAARWEPVPASEDCRLTVTNTSRPGTTLNALAHARTDVLALLAHVAEVTSQRDYWHEQTMFADARLRELGARVRDLTARAGDLS
jgi:hypothetical protein